MPKWLDSDTKSVGSPAAYIMALASNPFRCFWYIQHASSILLQYTKSRLLRFSPASDDNIAPPEGFAKSQFNSIVKDELSPCNHISAILLEFLRLSDPESKFFNISWSNPPFSWYRPPIFLMASCVNKLLSALFNSSPTSEVFALNSIKCDRPSIAIVANT